MARVLHVPTILLLTTTPHRPVGELLYVAINTCPAIMHHVHFLARFMTKATDKHLDYPKKILRYLKGQKGRKIKWGVNNVKHPFLPGQVHAFADSSWADVLPRRKSTYAYHLLVNNAVFAWKSAMSLSRLIRVLTPPLARNASFERRSDKNAFIDVAL